jgi:hypothetical protein
VGGWGIGGVATFQRGFPMVFSNGPANDVTLFGAGLRTDLLPQCHKSRLASQNNRFDGWFNTACFSVPADFVFGSEPRVDPMLRSDGVNNFDFAAFKRILFGRQDRTGFEFRWGFFNLLNRTQFAPPDTTCSASNNVNFGVMKSTVSGTHPRLLPLA